MDSEPPSDDDEEANAQYWKNKKLKQSGLHLKEPLQLVRIASLVDPTIQRYVSQRPGADKSVVYAGVNIKDGKAYIGKHSDGSGHLSFESTRKKDHENPSDKHTHYFACAMRVHGPLSFKWFILWHGDDAQVNDMERFWISPAGLHTHKPSGGWGYNLRTGGDGGTHAEETKEKMRIAHGTPLMRELHSKLMREQCELRSPETQDIINAKISKTMQLPEAKAANRKRRRDFFANEPIERKATRIQKQKNTKNTPEFHAAQSKRSKRQVESQEVRDALSKNAKEQRMRDIASGKMLLEERGKEAARIKREAKLALLTGSERECQILKNAREDRKSKKRAADLALLRTIAGHEDSKEKDLPEARSIGLIPKPPKPDVKAQMRREAAAGMKSLSQRRSDAHQAKRAQVLASLSGVEKERQQLKYAKTDEQMAKKKAKRIAETMQIPIVSTDVVL